MKLSYMLINLPQFKISINFEPMNWRFSLAFGTWCISLVIFCQGLKDDENSKDFYLPLGLR